jgi:hypothetical protein
VARCPQGHLFETPYIALVSFKAVRLGAERLQRCPVGKHWTRVTFVSPGELTEAEIAQAREHRTSPIP